MADPKGHYTGNGKYEKSMCERVLELYKNGESDVEVAVGLNISKSMFYRWIKEKAEFAAAVEKGKCVSEVWWQKLGRAGAKGAIPIQARVYLANMKNRFGWQENPFQEDDKVDENIVAIADALKALTAKHEREY